jgi:hypothetical protein
MSKIDQPAKDETKPSQPGQSNEETGAGTTGASSGPSGEVEEFRTVTAEKQPAVHKAKHAEEKEGPNPLLLDPYEFDHCTITIVYTRVGDQQASVSVHNHKDDPIVKTFPLVEVPLPLEIACVIERLLEIWPDARVSVTMALLPREGEAERRMAVSIRTGGDTPVVLAGPASEFPLPPPITSLLHELKELLPTRAMQKIEKEAKEKSKTPSKAAPAKLTSSAPTKPAAGQVDGKTQMTLF